MEEAGVGQECLLLGVTVAVAEAKESFCCPELERGGFLSFFLLGGLGGGLGRLPLEVGFGRERGLVLLLFFFRVGMVKSGDRYARNN